MPSGELAICTNGFYSQKGTACLYDEQVPVDANGNDTIVVSRAFLHDDGRVPGAWVQVNAWKLRLTLNGISRSRQTDPVRWLWGNARVCQIGSAARDA
ncbi:hypothetical protein R69888_03540 [Paraburkholderia haematera]|uniref:Uncharacterized protein n=2 Tax=Paraburkholderia haematera TaxID=2793077 RepID=A0ABM8RP64_9BURK|nr:hypothetical protein R69888_03540 [Paraburkholderia haematera]